MLRYKKDIWFNVPISHGADDAQARLREAAPQSLFGEGNAAPDLTAPVVTYRNEDGGSDRDEYREASLDPSSAEEPSVNETTRPHKSFHVHVLTLRDWNHLGTMSPDPYHRSWNPSLTKELLSPMTAVLRQVVPKGVATAAMAYWDDRIAEEVRQEGHETKRRLMARERSWLPAKMVSSGAWEMRLAARRQETLPKEEVLNGRQADMQSREHEDTTSFSSYGQKILSPITGWLAIRDGGQGARSEAIVSKARRARIQRKRQNTALAGATEDDRAALAPKTTTTPVLDKVFPQASGPDLTWNIPQSRTSSQNLAQGRQRGEADGDPRGPFMMETT